jgi:hypothetical protein
MFLFNFKPARSAPCSELARLDFELVRLSTYWSARKLLLKDNQDNKEQH